MRKPWKYNWSKVLKSTLIAVCAFLFFMGEKSISFAQTTGKVKVASAKIRQSADVNSTPIGSSEQGKTVTIVNEVTDSSGTLWYEVYVDANTTGYIRSDLIEDVVSDGNDTGTASNENSAEVTSNTGSEGAAVNTSAPGAEAAAETVMDAQYAVVKVPTAKVRTGASTSNGTVDTLPANAQVIVSGQTNGNDGQIWYFVNFTTSGGEEKTGYIRSDLLDLGEMVPIAEPEEQQQEEQQPSEDAAPQTENYDYELVYEGADGDYTWWLYDYTEGSGTRQKLEEVLAAAHGQIYNSEIDAKTISKQRIVIIVLIAVVIILAVVVTIMIFKLRDAYYEAYEDDDDEEDEEEDEEEEPVRRKSTVREEKQPEPRRKAVRSDRSMPAKEVTYEEEASVPVKTSQKRKAKNFMLEDDEFEFEFLNMKDKGKDV